MLDNTDIEAVCAEYTKTRSAFVDVASLVANLVSEALERAGIKHMVTSRAKAVPSLKRKLQLDREKHTPQDFKDGVSPPLKDLSGCRVLLYLPKDRQPAIDAIIGRFTGCTEHWAVKDRDKESGYRAHHIHVTLAYAFPCGEHPSHLGEVEMAIPCEIQVCTLTAHIWNELEHDIIYKIPGGSADDSQRELLKSLHAELHLCEGTVQRLMDVTATRAARNSEVIDTPEKLRYFLSSRWNCPVEGDLLTLLEILNMLMSRVTPAILDKNLKTRPGEVQEKEIASRLDRYNALSVVGRVAVAFVATLGPAEVLDAAEAFEPQRPLTLFMRDVARQFSQPGESK